MMPANRRMDEAWTIALVWLQWGKWEKWQIEWMRLELSHSFGFKAENGEMKELQYYIDENKTIILFQTTWIKRTNKTRKGKSVGRKLILGKNKECYWTNNRVILIHYIELNELPFTRWKL